jgi:hypothetical protein
MHYAEAAFGLSVCLCQMLSRLLFLAMFSEQLKQSLAHDHSGTIGRHMHLNFSAHIDNGIRICGFKHVAIFADDRGIPVDQLLRRAISFSIVAEQQRR